jgi:hypothetical protein
MNNKKIDEMATTEFNAIVDAFIERESQDCGELPANVFYDALENIFRNPEEATTVELEAQVIGSELQFALPDIALPGITVHNNQIMINNVRFVVRLSPVAVA